MSTGPATAPRNDVRPGTRRIPPEVIARQIEASDPNQSVWVTANAGSGKTHVLAQRVIRLLLAGVDPARILCITFTKAAAATMANRVFDTLAAWTALDDAALDAAVMQLGAGRPDPAQRSRARRLFATALETPGGLKVQTIHAFCAALLQRFPFEANVAARFSVLDGAAEAQLLDRLVLDVLLEAAAAPESDLGRALTQVIGFASDHTVREVVREAIGQRHAILSWLDRVGGVAEATAELSSLLGLGRDDTGAALEAALLGGALIPPERWPALAAVLAQGSPQDHQQKRRLERALHATGRERIAHYCALFVSATGGARRTLMTAPLAAAHPTWLERMQREQVRLVDLLARERAVQCRDRTAALLTIAAQVLRRYRAEKDRRGLLDYTDLIERTVALLEDVGAAWVLYKLDLGIDHILVDEAQDTSPPQWRIIELLASEFSAGAGARGRTRRTLFAVGDDKQSIFSFQGAAPQRLAEMRQRFRRRFSGAGIPWRDVYFEASFRSGQSVLEAVDSVFAHPDVYAALTSDAVRTVHRALPDAAPGVVEIWEPFEAQRTEAIDGWDAPFDELRPQDPRLRLAQRIAATIAAWLRQGRRPADILVLVRQRGPLFEAIIRELKTAQIAVAGADRLVLTEHIAVMDLMVLGDALLLPQDDLALASVLRSPLFGFTEEQLFELAWNRRGVLRAALREKAAGNAVFADAEARLAAWGELARTERPFTFYARLLGAEGGRGRFLARLGPDAADALDEFLNLALDYEKRETPSLQGFLAWLRRSEAEVKRDMEMSRDEVRVMTVHGAKGLEAPIVVLADTTTRPTGPRDPRLLALSCTDKTAQVAPPLVWAGPQGEDPPLVAAARGKARKDAADEHCRLLYVAMTRAAERLVVAAAQGLQRRPDNCWYDLVRKALWDHCTEEPADDGTGTVRRYRKGGVGESRPQLARAAQPEPALPGWLLRAAPGAADAAPVLAPSAALETGYVPRPYAARPASRAASLARGRLVHRLLQALPDIPADARAAAIERYLARHGAACDADARQAIAEQVMRVLDAEPFVHLFAPGSRGEVAIVGRIPRPGGAARLVSGQVDRLAVLANEVLIADFKTDRPPPCVAPPAYVAQLALYRAVLMQLYPGRCVRAALIFTDGPRLIEPTAADLDAALATVIDA